MASDDAAAASHGNTKRSTSQGGLSSCSDAARNMGNHLASRLVQLGVDTVFAVPGDYNLILLDQLIKVRRGGEGERKREREKMKVLSRERTR